MNEQEVVALMKSSKSEAEWKPLPGALEAIAHRIRVRDDHSTSRPGVFAGGDNVNGPDLVVTALADGRRAAGAIHQYLRSL
mgnify:CR=1 FL=1